MSALDGETRGTVICAEHMNHDSRRFGMNIHSVRAQNVAMRAFGVSVCLGRRQ